jgi:ketosteroid isomerase-like protein
MTTEGSAVTDEAQLRSLLDERVRAIHDKDIDGLMAHHARDVLAFDALNPLQYVGSEAVKERAGQWFSWYQGPIDYEIRDLEIATGDELAYCYYLYRISGRMTNGREVNMWLRATICFRKIDGSWVVTHEHTSVPFDAESGKASLDSEP